MQRVKSFTQRFGKMFVLTMMCALFVAMSCFSVFAAESAAVVTSEQLEPILQAANDNVAVIMPIGIGLLGISLGIGFLIMILMKFRRN